METDLYESQRNRKKAQEVNQALIKLSSEKTSVPDNISSEVLNNGDCKFEKKIALFQRITSTQKIPEEWRKSTLQQGR